MGYQPLNDPALLAPDPSSCSGARMWLTCVGELASERRRVDHARGTGGMNETIGSVELVRSSGLRDDPTAIACRARLPPTGSIPKP